MRLLCLPSFHDPVLFGLLLLLLAVPVVVAAASRRPSVSVSGPGPRYIVLPRSSPSYDFLLVFRSRRLC